MRPFGAEGSDIEVLYTIYGLVLLLMTLAETAPAFAQMPVNPESAAKAKGLFDRAVKALG